MAFIWRYQSTAGRPRFFSYNILDDKTNNLSLVHSHPSSIHALPPRNGYDYRII